jgi:hypothetical protein
MPPSTPIRYFFQRPFGPCSHTGPPWTQGGMLPPLDEAQPLWTLELLGLHRTYSSKDRLDLTDQHESPRGIRSTWQPEPLPKQYGIIRPARRHVQRRRRESHAPAIVMARHILADKRNAVAPREAYESLQKKEGCDGYPF